MSAMFTVSTLDSSSHILFLDIQKIKGKKYQIMFFSLWAKNILYNHIEGEGGGHKKYIPLIPNYMGRRVESACITGHEPN